MPNYRTIAALVIALGMGFVHRRASATEPVHRRVIPILSEDRGMDRLTRAQRAFPSSQADAVFHAKTLSPKRRELLLEPYAHHYHSEAGLSVIRGACAMGRAKPNAHLTLLAEALKGDVVSAIADYARAPSGKGERQTLHARIDLLANTLRLLRVNPEYVEDAERLANESFEGIERSIAPHPKLREQTNLTPLVCELMWATAGNPRSAPELVDVVAKVERNNDLRSCFYRERDRIMYGTLFLAKAIHVLEAKPLRPQLFPGAPEKDDHSLQENAETTARYHLDLLKREVFRELLPPTEAWNDRHAEFRNPENEMLDGSKLQAKASEVDWLSKDSASSDARQDFVETVLDEPHVWAPMVLGREILPHFASVLHSLMKKPAFTEEHANRIGYFTIGALAHLKPWQRPAGEDRAQDPVETGNTLARLGLSWAKLSRNDDAELYFLNMQEMFENLEAFTRYEDDSLQPVFGDFF